MYTKTKFDLLKQHSEIFAPLINLVWEAKTTVFLKCKKCKLFVWINEHNIGIAIIKELIASDIILAYPDFD